MGDVWRARDPRLGRDVAIKVLPDDVAGNPHALARFEREARAVAALSHPTILALFDIGEENGIRYAVTELLEGESLRGALARGTVPLKRTLDLAAQLADALASAHEKGIVHRDVKPENIFLTKDGRAKLLDFGLARQSALPSDPSFTDSPTEEALTERGSVVGTISYMSPEQASGQAVDFRSDQFSLGIVLYEMLTGARPFRGNTVAETLTAIIREEPEPLEKAAPSVPMPVRLIVERLLAKEPSGRFAATRDLAQDLATWRLHISGTLAGGVAATVAVPQRRWAGKPLLAGVATGLAIGAIALGIWTWRSAVPAAPPRVARFTIDLPPGQRIVPSWDTHFTFSRDSKTLLYLANAVTGIVGLHERRLDDVESRLLPDGKGLRNPIYSPDGRWLATVDSNKALFVKIPLGG